MDGQLIDNEQEASVSTWDNYAITLKSYQTYLKQKVKAGKSQYDLDFTDLLYASNYKAGSGSIQEDFSNPKSKANLTLYGDLLKEIHGSFNERGLESLDEEGLGKLVSYADRMVELCSAHHVKGLGVPYCSALFHMHFPDLFPVLDRNVLLGIGDIVEMNNIQKSGQIWKIERYYEGLIRKLYAYLINSTKSLRDADRELFSKGKKIYETRKLNIAS